MSIRTFALVGYAVIYFGILYVAYKIWSRIATHLEETACPKWKKDTVDVIYWILIIALYVVLTKYGTEAGLVSTEPFEPAQ